MWLDIPFKNVGGDGCGSISLVFYNFNPLFCESAVFLDIELADPRCWLLAPCFSFLLCFGAVLWFCF